jgi:hypothetical protein
MPTLLSDRDAVKARRKAEQRAALARAKQWHEERLNSLPLLHDPTSSKTLKPSPKKLTNTSTTTTEAMPDRKSPTRAEKAEARMRARAWADEKKRATVPAAIDTKQRGNAHRIAVVEEDSSTSDFSDDFQTALTRSNTKDNGQILVSKAHVKKVFEMKNQMKMALKKFEDLCEPYEESINSKLESMDIDE